MKETKIAFCIVNDIDSYTKDDIKTITKNILDHTISNLYIKKYDVFVGVDEDTLLQSLNNYDYAVVMSPGTEYINGVNFFNALNILLEKDFFVAGHVLDRHAYNAYYELHHQCYVINLKYYKELNYPIAGKLELNVQHDQLAPVRSTDNWHDDYTPKFVSAGTVKQTYSNKCHGWNFLKVAFENNLPVLVFDESIRNNKKHYYPESEQDFYEHLKYIEHKFNFCKDEFVHTDNTECNHYITDEYNQVVIPASGTLYLDKIKQGIVVFYDYNQSALDYWKEHCPRKENIVYKFIKTDLLNSTDLVNHIDPNLKTLVNLSNIFCYEGTAAYYSLEHRLTAQNNLLKRLDEIKDVTVNFTIKADAGHNTSLIS
jgi:hypothetical protein